MTTMVDSKIGKTFQKSVGRAKEKLLQNLGKVDRTADEILDEQITNFNKQQGAATRLQKELNNYIRCIRACAAASRSLLESVGEVYEPEWGGKELLTVNSQSVELLWNDFAHRLAEQGQFPEMRKKIEKRSRKLIDFDGERHALQALQANPRRAEAKLAKQREALEAAKRTYEVLNSELHDELPSLYNSRIVFLVSAMSTLFASENIFHSETSKVFTELEGIVERLSKESAKGNLNFKVPSNAIINHTGTDSPKDEKGGNTSPVSPVSNTSSIPPSPVSPPRPTSLNMSSTPSSEQGSLTPNNKLAEGSNHVTSSNGPTKIESTNNTTNNTNGTTIDNASSNKDTPATTKMVNGGTESDGESPPVTPVTNDTEPGNMTPAKEISEKTVESPETQQKVVDQVSDDNKKDNNTNTTTGMDEINNNNDAIIAAAASAAVTEKKHADKVDDDKVTEQGQSNNNEQTVDTTKESKNISDEKCKNEKNNNIVESDGPAATIPSRGVIKPLHGILSQSKHANGELSDSKESPSKENSPSLGDSKEPGVLYRVRATYRYQKEDVDELSFEAGEVIRVIEYDEPEEQEEGWLMGVKDNGEKGLFPANFTRPI